MTFTYPKPGELMCYGCVQLDQASNHIAMAKSLEEQAAQADSRNPGKASEMRDRVKELKGRADRLICAGRDLRNRGLSIGIVGLKGGKHPAYLVRSTGVVYEWAITEALRKR